MKVVQKPNGPAITALLGAVIMTITPPPLAGFGSALFLSASSVWAYFEITRGDNPVRKVFGWIVAIGVTAVVVWRFTH